MERPPATQKGKGTMKNQTNTFGDGAAVVVNNPGSRFRGFVGSVQSTRRREGLETVGVNFTNGRFGQFADVPFLASELQRFEPNEDDQ